MPDRRRYPTGGIPVLPSVLLAAIADIHWHAPDATGDFAKEYYLLYPVLYLSVSLANITIRRASTLLTPVTFPHTTLPGQEPLSLTWSIGRTTQNISSMHARHRLSVEDIQGRDILMRCRRT